MPYIRKIFEPTFSEIRRMETMTDVIVEGMPCIPSCNSIHKEDRKYILSFEAILDNTLLDAANTFSLGGLVLRSEENTYEIKNNEAYFMGYDFMTYEAQTFRICISNLKHRNIDNDREYYMRMILPVERNWWIHDMHSYGIESDYGFFGSLLFPRYEKGDVHIYSVTDRVTKQQYMVVEPQYLTTIKELYDVQYSVAMGMGLITGTAIFGEGYVVASDTQDYSFIIGCNYISMRESIRSQYKVFTTNLYSLLTSLKLGKNNGYAISQISKDGVSPISYLVNWLEEKDYTPIFLNLYKYPELARAVVILIDGTDKALDYQAAMFSVALETICTKLKEIYGLKYKGILDNDVWTQIRKRTQKSLLEGLKELGMDEKGISRFEQRLSNLNDISNSEKFITTITRTGLSLSEMDQKTIDQRNLLLHGNLVKKTAKDSDTFDDMYYYAVALHTLCCKILFKFCGYNGYIVNGAVVLDRKPACEKHEPVLIKI